ncbi:MAG TPA: hypothetical protein VGS06_40110 [Streptosporangiaceae bacterium]|nr:hypothetical protein [Streptosporangiaceae bacterium]
MTEPNAAADELCPVHPAVEAGRILGRRPHRAAVNVWFAAGVAAVITGLSPAPALTALATTENCTTCNSLAEAFQIVYATDKWSVVRWEVQAAAYQVAFRLRMLQYSRLSTTQIQAESTGLIDNFISWLQGNSENSTGWSPAINGAGQTTLLTGSTQPYIGLLTTIQH